MKALAATRRVLAPTDIDDLREHLLVRKVEKGLDSKCIERIPTICDTVSDVLDRYEITRRLGGGKSGAIVAFVKEKIGYLSSFFTDSEERVMKLYPGTYDASGTVLNERPLREISVLCEMSGVRGFPMMFESGCVLWESEKCPYVIINKMRGTVLTKLNVASLEPKIRLGIALQLLRLLGEAKEHLGEHFQHFDLHPDNIFVDLDNCVDEDYVLDGIKFRCPSVSIIDFDLVHSDKFAESTAFSADLLPEQVAKLRGPVTIPERTINFTLKWLGPSQTSDLLGKLRLVKYATDIRNWLAIFAVLVHGIDGGRFKLCEDPIECVESNKWYFIHYLVYDPDLITEAARIVAPEMSLERFGEKLDVTFEYLQNFLRNAKFAKDIREFFDESQTKSGFYPVIDNIAVGASVSRERPLKFRITAEGADVVDISLKGIRISCLFKEMKPLIYINFDDFKIFFGTYTVMEKILRSLFDAVRTWGGKPLMESLTAIFGAVAVAVEDGAIEEPTLMIRNLRLIFDGPFVVIKGTFAASTAYGYLLSASLRVKATAARFGYMTDLGFDITENTDGSFSFSAKQSLEGPKHPCVLFAEHLDEYIAGDKARYNLCVQALTGTLVSLTEPYVRFKTEIQTAARGSSFELFLEHLDDDYHILNTHLIDYKKYAFDFASSYFRDALVDRVSAPKYRVLVDMARHGRVGPLDVLNVVYNFM